MIKRERKNLSPMQTLLWLLAIVLVPYCCLFALLCVDEFLLNNCLIWDPMQKYFPHQAVLFQEFCQLIYYPEIQLMKALRIIPA